MRTPSAPVVAVALLIASSTLLGQSRGMPGRVARPAAPDAHPARLLVPQPVIHDVKLVDADGHATNLRDVLSGDRAVFVNFIFTSCTTICPLMSAGFSQFQASLGAERDHVRLVSISINPDTDTPEVLSAYAKRYHAGPSWVFLTGKSADVEAIERAFGAYRGDPVNHEPVTYVRRRAQAPWEALDGFSSVDRLMRALQPAALGSRF